MTALPDTADRLAAALADRYRVERLLDTGGMATVYLARDLRHGRTVAIKVLKPELAAVIGAERFLAEIRTTANLQHPHILGLFDSGEVEGTAYYVMPFVDGESLRDRLAREGQLPVADALRITREVADALEYAHRKGVIHRDIKPENILLAGGASDARSAHAFVADFGIALAVSNTGGQRLTETGLSLGTPAYMSPEQAMGERTLDARADVYALGCVLYEMLTGEPPFTGPSAQAIMARVLTEEPRPLAQQRRTAPASVIRAVEVALSKLPADRFASAASFAQALDADASASGRAPERYVAHRSGQISISTIALGTGVVLATAAAVWGWLRPRPEQPVTRSYVKFPDAEAPVDGRKTYALLPNGSALVYVGKGSNGGTQLWMKKRSELHATAIGGTSGATSVFTSPDGNWIGFIGGAKLRKVPVTGGETTTLANAACTSIACMEGAESATWLDDGHIVYVSEGGLLRIRENGGAIDTLTSSAATGGLAPILPQALPGSRGVLFTACTLYCNKSNVMVISTDTKVPRLLVEDALLPQYSATGHLVYVDAASGAGMAIRFDLPSLTTSGTATAVIDRVANNLVVSPSGTLAYVDGDRAARSELVVVDREGRTVASVDSTWRANFANLAISPDGKRVVTSIVADGNEHLWIKPLDGGPPFRLTNGRQQNTTPAWTADGAGVLFTRFEGTSKSTFIERRVEGGTESTLKSGDEWVIEALASRDSQWIVTRQYRTGGKRDIYARTVRGDTTERLVVGSPSDDISPSLSPDAKWMTYASNEAGRREAWVVPFPDPKGQRWQLSTEGGYEPTWSPNGREVFYINPQLELTAVEVSTTDGFRIVNRRVLFKLDGYRRHFTHRAYEPLPDGRHLIMIREGAPPMGDLVMVDNWFADLAARIPR